MTRDDLQRLSDAGMLTGTVDDAARVLERGPKPEDLPTIWTAEKSECFDRPNSDGLVALIVRQYSTIEGCIALRDWLDSVIAWHGGKPEPKRMTAAAIAERLVCARQNILHVAGAGIHPYDSNTGAAAAERSVRVLVATALRDMGVAE